MTHTMDVPLNLSSSEMQSWVFNRLPLNAHQKWELIQTLKEEKLMTQDEIDALNKTEFFDDEKRIQECIEFETKKLQELDLLSKTEPIDITSLALLHTEHSDGKIADIHLESA